MSQTRLYEDDDSEEAGSSWLGYGGSDDDDDDFESGVTVQPASQASQDYGDNLPLEELQQKAEVKYDTVRLFFDVKWTAAGLSNKGVLKENGKLLLSYAKGDLVLDEHDNPNDFGAQCVFEAPVAGQLDARHGSKKQRRHHKLGARRDIVQGVSFSKLTTTWPGALGVALPTIDSRHGEGWHRKQRVVTKTFAPGEFSATETRDAVILAREPTKGEILFNNRFGGVTVDTYRKDFRQLAGDAWTLPVKNPLVMYMNASVPPEEQVLKAATGMEHLGLCTLKKDVIDRFAPITEKNMREGLVFADITENFTVELFVPIASKRLAQDQEFQATGKGLQWKNFADEYAAMPLADVRDKAKVEEWKNTEYRTTGYVNIAYKAGGSQIAMDTKK